MPVTRGRASCVFGGRSGAGGQAEALAAVIDPAFLVEAGWDAGLRERVQDGRRRPDRKAGLRP